MPRPQKIASTADMFAAARLFYREGLSKKEISAKLRTDTRGVTRLLNEAQRQGVVRIQIYETAKNNLEQRIRAKYSHLEKVMIVSGPEIRTEEQCDDVFRRFGALAADYFEELFESHPQDKPFHVGVTGGERLLEFATAVPVRFRENVHVQVVALVGRGRLGESASHVEPNVAASILWTHCGAFPGHCEYETVEPYRIDKTPGPEAREAATIDLMRLKKLPSIKAVIQDMDRLDAVFAGFGFLNSHGTSQAIKNRITMGSLLKSVVTKEQLVKEGAVGDFCYCPFDAEGNSPQDKDWQFFMTAGHYSKYRGIDFYKRMVETGKKVVGFGGPHLLPVIRAALNGKFVNVLIVDEFTARQLTEDE
jgi:DNA-binding transcriptional regulator LsrR (DeoR family)